MFNKRSQGVSGAEKRKSSLQEGKADVLEIFQIICWQQDDLQFFNICLIFMAYIHIGHARQRVFLLLCIDQSSYKQKLAHGQKDYIFIFKKKMQSSNLIFQSVSSKRFCPLLLSVRSAAHSSFSVNQETATCVAISALH